MRTVPYKVLRAAERLHFDPVAFYTEWGRDLQLEILAFEELRQFEEAESAEYQRNR